MRQDAVEEVPAEFRQLLFALFIPEKIRFAFGDGDVGVHTAAVHAHDRLGQEASRESHVVGDLPAEQLIKLDLISGSNHFGIAEVDLELAGRDFRVVLLVLEAHGALHFSRSINELAQGIERHHMVVAAGVDELEFAGLDVFLLRILTREQKALDLGGSVQRVVLVLEQLVGVVLEHTAHIARVGRAVLVDDVAEDQHFAITEDVGGHPVESAPVNAQTEIALLLRRESANRRAIEGQVLIGAEQEFLVVVEQMQTPLEIGEQHRNRFNPLLIGQILQAFFADFGGRQALEAVALGLQVQRFQLFIGEGKKIPVLVRHGAPFVRAQDAGGLAQTLAQTA